jgi:ubiquinone/menaquinone biosynthesis C-methylase UbiE
MQAESHYDRVAAQEWTRLDRHRTEFVVTLRTLKAWLPPPPCAVLDVGGGPGRYAIALAQRGYTVTLFDISSQSLRLAREKAAEAGVSLAETVHGTATELGARGAWGADHFDAVLLMGPLYHLLAEEERVQAVHEAMRVLVPGGPLFAAFITRFAAFRVVANENPTWLVDHVDYAAQLLDTGIHDQPTTFAQAYYAHPAEVIPFMERCGLTTRALVGCEGVVGGHEKAVNDLEGAAWEAWVDLNVRLSQDPSLRGAADHLLYVGEKP